MRGIHERGGTIRGQAFRTRPTATGATLLLAAASVVAAAVPAGADTAKMPGALRALPDVEELARYVPPIGSRIYSRDGRQIGRYGVNRRLVSFDELPKLVIHAFVAAEDQRFFQHGGIDPVAMSRAAAVTLTSDDLIGGSTITQQLAKAFLLTRGRTFERKIKEIVLALRLEQALSKERILAMYLNRIYLGNGAYGVAAGARVYFGKTLDALTVAEAAQLAALPKAPSRINPIDRPLEAMKRRDYVIDRMLEDGYITAAQAHEAKQASYAPPRARPSVDPEARYFVEHVRRRLVARYGKTAWKRGGLVVRTSLDRAMQRVGNAVLRDGLVAVDRRHGYRGPVASLAVTYGKQWSDGWADRLGRIERPAAAPDDWRLAAVLEVSVRSATIGFGDGSRGTIPLAELKWARKQGRVRVGDTYALEPIGPWIGRASQVLSPGDVILVEARSEDARGNSYPPDTYTLRQIPEVTGALVALDARSGKVRAMVGGFGFARSQYNMATQARRQPGSAFKPIVYLTALENGFTPSTIVRDSPVYLRTPSGKGYSPTNYGNRFYGPMTLRRALELSRNVATVRLSQRVGLDPIAITAERLGLIDRGRRRVLSLALGAYEVTPLRIAAAYASFANGGLAVTPTAIDEVTGHRSRAQDRCEGCIADTASGFGLGGRRAIGLRVASAESAFQLTQMLRGVIQRGTGRVIASLDRPIAGKTGTTNDFVDAWFVGYTPDLVVAVWVGYANRLSLGRREQGGVTAAPIFKAFMKRVLDGRDTPDFEPPPNLVPITVSLDSGLPRKHGRVITEYFKPGREPKRWAAYSPDKSRRVRRGQTSRRVRRGQTAEDEETDIARKELRDRRREHVDRGTARDGVRRRVRREREPAWVRSVERSFNRYGR